MDEAEVPTVDEVPVGEFDNLQLISFEDPRIHIAPPEFNFEQDSANAQPLIDALFAKMFEWQGLGLSANQVGLPYKVFVMGTKETQIALFNPRVVGVSKEYATIREGCLTYPGLFLTLKRPESCTVAYQTATGEHVVQQFPGLAARIALHEYDHMLGVDFTAHASHFKIKHELKMLRNRIKKSIRQQQIDYIRNQKPDIKYKDVDAIS